MYCMFCVGCGLWHWEFCKICVVSLHFSSFTVNMALVIDCSGHLLLRYSHMYIWFLYRSSARSPMSYHFHLFSFLLILVTHFSCHILGVPVTFIWWIFFISDAKCCELGEVCIYKMYPHVWNSLWAFQISINTDCPFWLLYAQVSCYGRKWFCQTLTLRLPD
jgi:hypothetical protein